MGSGIRRLAPIIAAVLALAGVGVASTFEPQPLPTCPSRNGQATTTTTTRGKNNGTAPVTCKPAAKAKVGQG